MADQTVSLKLQGDADDLQRALNESGQAMDDLSGKAESSASDIENSVSGASSAWEDHSGAINAAAAAMGAAGAMAEGFARSQQDATIELGRTSTVTGIQSDALRDLAADTANVTFATEDVIGTFHTLGRQGVDTEDDLQRVANVWDLVADATGENVVALAESSVALRTLGIDAREPEEALDAFGFITTQTTGSVSEFLTFIERTGPELRELGLDVDDTAALMGVLENEMGMTGRVARTEFRQAVNEANGDMGVMLDILGVTPEAFAAMRGEVTGSSQALHDNAAAFEASFTPLQRLSAWIEETSLRYGGLADAAGMLSPVLVGGGGLLFGVNQIIVAKQRWAATNATVSGSLMTLVRRLGPIAAALAVTTDAVNTHRAAYGELSAELEGLDFTETVEALFQTEFGWNTLTDAVRDSVMPWRAAAESFAEGRVLLDSFRGSTEDAADATPELTAEVSNLTDAERSARQHIAAANEMLDAQAGQHDETASATQRHRDALAELVGDQRAAVDPVFALERAMGRYDDVLNDTEASSWDVARAVAEVERAALDGDLSFDAFEGKLRDWVRAGRITEAQADDIRDSVREMREEADGWAGDYDANLRLTVEMSQADLNMADRWTAAAEAASRHGGRVPSAGSGSAGSTSSTSGSSGINTAATRNALRRAEGGPVWPDEWFMVGEEGPELVQFPANGQVYSAPETAQMMQRGGDGASAGAVHLTVHGEPSPKTMFRARDLAAEYV